SRFTWVFFLATKDETSGILKSFITRIENLVVHKKVDEDPIKESKCKDQEMEVNVNSTNNVNTPGNVNTVSLTVNAADVSTLDFSSDDEDDGAVADMNNLDTTIHVSLILATRIHKDHLLDQVIRDLQSTTQTRKMSKNLEEHGFVSSMIKRVSYIIIDEDGFFINR
nr:ribonuclease H-like domain-containing protein [Tanacetum cinerariifolium]